MTWGGLSSLRIRFPAGPATLKGGRRQNCLPHICFILIVLSSNVYAAEWIKVASPKIEVMTDAGEKTGRDLLRYFEASRAVFQDAGISDAPFPVRVFVFASEGEFRGYREDRSVGGFHRGGDRDYIALYAGPNARTTAAHEYVHVILSHSKLALPAWFEEGTADFYSNLEINGTKLNIGSPIVGRLAVLNTENWLDAKQMMSKARTDAMFYAESWALTHMLNLSPGWRGGMAGFVVALSENREPEEAFRDAFGKTMAQALVELRGYVSRMEAVVVTSAAHSLTVAPQSAPQVGKLSTVAAAVARAELALHIDRPELARSLVEKAAGTLDTAEVAAARGEIALAEKRPDEARKYFKRAVELGSHDAEMWFQYANLESSNEFLWKVIEIDPDFAEAQFLLGERLTDDGDFAVAIEHLKTAVRVRPKESYYWHALGLAQAKAGLRDDAMVSARRAKATAVTDPMEAMADALIAMARGPLPKAPPKGPDVVTPSSWQDPKGDSRIEGVLTQVDCETDFARLHVTAGGGRSIALEVRHPDRVRLVGAPETQHAFECGKQQMKVVVEYFGATSEVTKIEFRQ
jgi:tetratricopeptide (TPR) repeat protein